jgi:hypothetical protein
MKKFLLIVMVIALGWYGNQRYRQREPEQAIAEPTHERAEKVQQRDADAFKCDGRTRCSQMTSCAEATFFIRNCPDTKMDGDHDGVPCESQWCS